MIDNVPVVGAFLGAFVSAGDMMAITGIQMMLMLQIRATFGKDPDVAQMWELLPIVGGGFGWRALARELVGLHPGRRHLDQIGDRLRRHGRRRRRRDVLRMHGRHMANVDAAKVYDEARTAAQSFARDVLSRIRRNGN